MMASPIHSTIPPGGMMLTSSGLRLLPQVLSPTRRIFVSALWLLGLVMPRLLPATIPGWAWNNAQPALMTGRPRQIRCFTLQFGAILATGMADMQRIGQAMPIQHELNQEWIWTHRAFWS